MEQHITSPSMSQYNQPDKYRSVW